jgi:GxxExxY protein
MAEIVEKELSYALQGALMEVFNRLGPGFREETYKRALVVELSARGIPYEVEKSILIRYRGDVIDEYHLDLVIDGKIIVELKAVSEIHPRFEAQLLSYLKASGLRLGYLVNFGSDRLFMKRLLRDPS